MIPTGIIWITEENWRREDGVFSPSLSHPSVDWALKDIHGQEEIYVCVNRYFLLFLCLVVSSFGSTWFTISKLKYEFSKNKLFSKMSNIGLLCGFEWYLDWFFSCWLERGH